MATLLKNNGIGAYIVEEENGQIAANTPGGIDLDNLTDGDSYIYIEDVTAFVYTIDNNARTGFSGLETNSYAPGKVQVNTLGACQSNLVIRGIVTNAQAYNISRFSEMANRIGEVIPVNKYLVRMYATGSASGTNFKSFPNASGTSKYYIPVIVRMCTQNESGTAGKDNVTIELTMEGIWT